MREQGPANACGRTGSIAISVGALALVAALVPAHAVADQRVPLERVPASKVLTAGERETDVDRGRAPRSRAAGRRGIELLTPHPNRLRKRKARAARRLSPADRGELGPTAESGGDGPEPAAASFLNQLGLVAGNGTPPDSTGAIGPTDYVEIVNREVGVFERAGLGLEDSIDLDDFAGVGGFNVFDPQIQWDPASGRWLYVADAVVGPGDNFLAVGWTADDADPDPLPFGDPGAGGQWCQFLIDTDDEFDDYPKLGHSDDFITIGTNVFDDSGGPEQDNFLGSRIWVIRKPAGGDDSCTLPVGDVFVTGLPLPTPDGDVAFTPVPANTFESSANSYVVAADDPFGVASANEIAQWRLTQIAPPPAAPTLVLDGEIPVAGFNVPANVPQPGTNAVLDSLDTRLTQAVARTNPATGAQSVWTQHTVNGSGGRSVVRWYELRTDNLTARQQGTISDPSSFVFNGAISPSANGSSAVINHNVGGSSLLAQIQARSRLGGTQLSRMGNPVALATSAAADRDLTCFDEGGPCRWGDYAGATPDPANAALVWGSNQVNGPPSGLDPAWRTRNFALLPTGTGPDTTITSGPANGSTIATPATSFGFASNDAGATFQCRVDGGAFAACTSPRTFGPVPNGVHSFEVRAIGGGGLVDPSPASRSFTVNAPGPTTQISKGPKGKRRTKKKRFKGRFRFEATDPGGLPVAETECKLDKKDWRPCTSPHTVKVRAKRKFKRHTFSVRATNELGTTGEAAQRKWRVKRKRR